MTEQPERLIPGEFEPCDSCAVHEEANAANQYCRPCLNNLNLIARLRGVEARAFKPTFFLEPPKPKPQEPSAYVWIWAILTLTGIIVFWPVGVGMAITLGGMIQWERTKDDPEDNADAD